MITLLSPAKSLDYKTERKTTISSTPELIDESVRLVDVMRKKSAKKIASLMKVSDQIAQLNYDRYQEWSLPFDEQNAKACVYAFQGDVYRGLNAADFDGHDEAFAQDHLRILSGLYGLLKPMDLMQAYRLEMGTRLKTARGKDLYGFWKLRITDALNKVLESHDIKVVINAASNEYWKAIHPDKVKAKIVTVQFKDWKNGEYKFIQTYGKIARGLLARFIIKNRINDLESIKGFDLDGYYFSPDLSDEGRFIYLRDH